MSLIFGGRSLNREASGISLGDLQIRLTSLCWGMKRETRQADSAKHLKNRFIVSMDGWSVSTHPALSGSHSQM